MSLSAPSAFIGSTVVGLALAVTSAGCDFDVGSNDFRYAIHHCSMKTEPIAFEAEGRLGISAAELLAHTAVRSVGSIELVSGDVEGVEVWFVANPTSARQPAVWADGLAPCSSDGLFVDGTLRIVSDRGLLDESLEVTIEAVRDVDIDSNYIPTIRLDLSMRDIQGSLSPETLLEEPGFQLIGLELSGSFEDGAFEGLISASAEKHTRRISEWVLFDLMTLSTERVPSARAW